jgi:hypothetical protein
MVTWHTMATNDRLGVGFPPAKFSFHLLVLLLTSLQAIAVKQTHQQHHVHKPLLVGGDTLLTMPLSAWHQQMTQHQHPASQTTAHGVDCWYYLLVHQHDTTNTLTTSTRMTPTMNMTTTVINYRLTMPTLTPHHNCPPPSLQMRDRGD